MLDPAHPIARLLRRDRRYKLEAYAFLFDALEFAHNHMGLGKETHAEEVEAAHPEAEEAEPEPADEGGSRPERHVTGQELCEAARRYALEQYGLMAKCVLNSWGIRQTGDFGEIVYNLIKIGRMRKTKNDRREDFDNVYDFDQALTQEFRITLPTED
jgi:uncharacterized repeat protein (TIGR04138 family)